MESKGPSSINVKQDIISAQNSTEISARVSCIQENKSTIQKKSHNKSIVSKETQKSSRIPGFYELPLSERVRWVEQFAELSQNQKQALLEFRPLGQELTDIFIENAIGNYALPL
nr:hypothetical protein [Oligoflexales bacterium]